MLLLSLHAPPQSGPADAENFTGLALITSDRLQHFAQSLLFGKATRVSELCLPSRGRLGQSQAVGALREDFKQARHIQKAAPT